MNRPDINYDCYLGIYDPLTLYDAQDSYNPVCKAFDPSKKYVYSGGFTQVDTTPEDAGGCLGCTDIFVFDPDNSPKALLVAKPFRDGGTAIVEYKDGNNWVAISYSLYVEEAEIPRFIWLPAKVRKVAFNIRVEDMGYEPSWYTQDSPIPYKEPTNQDFINSLNLYFMYRANPYYSKLQITKERDTQNAPTGRFLRDKIQTDLTFRAEDYETIINDHISEYAVCAVAFWEHFDDSSNDYMAACTCFNRADAEVNFSERYVQPKLKTLDSYTWLIDKYSTKKNVVDLKPASKSLKFKLPYVIQLYVEGSSTVTNICGDYSWEQEVDPISGLTIFNYGFHPIKTSILESCIPNFTDSIYGNMIVARLLIGYQGNNTLHFAPLSKRYRVHRDEYFAETPPHTGAIHIEVPDNGIDGRAWDLVFRFKHNPPDPDKYCILDSTPYYVNGELTGYYYVLVEWWHYEDMLSFQETNYHTYRPTEFGSYQPTLYYTNEGLAVDSDLQGVKPLPVFKVEWGEYSCWVSLKNKGIPNDMGGNLAGFLVAQYSRPENHWCIIQDTYALQDVIQVLLKAYGLSIEFSLQENSSQLIYDNDKVNFLRLDDIVLTPATNITRGNYTQAAQKMELSLKDLLDEICDLCNAGWHIDGYGLHIEGNEFYDNGRSYSGVTYNPQFDFETAKDEFNDTNLLFGQLSSSTDTSKLWHTLTLNGDDKAAKHFKTDEMQAKAPYCAKDKTQSPTFVYDLIRAAVMGAADDSGIVCVGTELETPTTPDSSVRIADLCIVDMVEGKAAANSTPMQKGVMLNMPFAWPVLKGRYLYGMPADRKLIDYNWILRQYWITAMGSAKAYTAPHRYVKIRMPIVSEIYTRSWHLVKTTLGYGIITKIDFDMVARIATTTVEIIEYNL